MAQIRKARLEMTTAPYPKTAAPTCEALCLRHATPCNVRDHRPSERAGQRLAAIRQTVLNRSPNDGPISRVRIGGKH